MSIAERVAARFRARLAREGEIANNPAIEAMGAHLEGEEDDPSPQVSTPAAERFNTHPKNEGFPGAKPFGQDNQPPAKGEPQKSIPGER